MTYIQLLPFGPSSEERQNMTPATGAVQVQD